MSHRINPGRQRSWVDKGDKRASIGGFLLGDRLGTISLKSAGDWHRMPRHRGEEGMLLGDPKFWTLDPDDDPCQGGEMAKGVGLSGSSQRRRSQHWGDLGLT
ncbi:MAG: hypothetical protein ACRC8Y_08730 [Chroococcales cyanobacterium]